ncbi:MAG: baeRF3 domain-containing protein [Chitinophagaceae bacterium]
MKPILDPALEELLEARHSHPSISLMLPFEPKMTAKADLNRMLKKFITEAEDSIREKHDTEIGWLVLNKLRQLVASLNFSTYKKSIAIYVSPFFEKVLYLDILVEPKLTINGSFAIREVLLYKKKARKFLLLTLSGKECKAYIGDSHLLMNIKTDIPSHIAAFRSDLPEKVGNFSDSTEIKQVLTEKFLRYTDQGLTALLHAYSLLPVFVVGTKKILGTFRKVTRNEKHIISYIHGSHVEDKPAELLQLLMPYLNDWEKVHQQDIRHQLEIAADGGLLARGLHEVLKQANRQNARLLVLEKDYTSAAPAVNGKNYSKFSYIKDSVDEVIEKVLEAGGDVEFMESGMLDEYQHISLIERYKPVVLAK